MQINKKIPYGKQDITEEDIKAVTEVLRSEMLTQGPRVKEFENNFADYVGAKYAVAVSNGTAALHLAAKAMGVKPGDKIITSPITFVATANSVRYCGGEVVFADIDPETCLLDIDKVESILQLSPKGTYQGIIPIDFSGRAVNLEEFRKLADEYGMWLIEDSAHAPGGYFNDSNNEYQFCGNGRYADLAIFSFHPVKHITSGEGGMITTNNEEYYKHLLNLRTHGIQQDFSRNIYADKLWYYEMQELGFNYRISDIHAALGVSQLKRADFGLKRRREIAAKYFNTFNESSYVIRQSGIVDGHAYHLYVLEVEHRQELHSYLRENNIFAQIHYIPVHLMPYYRNLGWKPGDFPNSENYYSNCISIPIYPGLSNEEQEFVINKIKEFYNE